MHAAASKRKAAPAAGGCIAAGGPSAHSEPGRARSPKRTRLLAIQGTSTSPLDQAAALASGADPAYLSDLASHEAHRRVLLAKGAKRTACATGVAKTKTNGTSHSPSSSRLMVNVGVIFNSATGRGDECRPSLLGNRRTAAQFRQCTNVLVSRTPRLSKRAKKDGVYE